VRRRPAAVARRRRAPPAREAAGDGADRAPPRLLAARYYAAELNTLSFLGFPLGFYILAQGALIVFLLIVVAYVFAMNRLDRRYGVGERR
jgi:putative solute:sodium symporter small subunit